MDLPFSNDVGYSELPAYHLYDSFESNEGPSDVLYTFNSSDNVISSQIIVATRTTLNNGSFLARNGGSPFQWVCCL
ncbi:hypothetical protein GOP47_0028565 [Adiantum capillus-veneris]|nr:hypothetical protein GOP47_0028565 [Adiantum capillus-veneris]